MRVLDPAAGAGILLCATVESLVHRGFHAKIELVAYEVDPKLADILRDVLRELQFWCHDMSAEMTFTVICRDFILEHADALQNMGGLFPALPAADRFDIVISNPPYFKLNKADPRAQAAASVVHGQPNIYGLFMAVSAALLHQGGQLIFITPRSFASGPYFRAFRELFFAHVKPQLIHIFGSRKDAFSRDAVLQENVILKGVREDHWSAIKALRMITISTSQGTSDLATPSRRAVRLDAALDMTSRDKILRLSSSVSEDELVRLVDSWPGNLGAYGLQISTGPVVPFRATMLIDKSGNVPETHLPLLWMNHVRSMVVTWPLRSHKKEYIKNLDEAYPILVPNKNYVLLRRFSAKEEERRLVAGPYLAAAHQVAMLGLENHLNYVYRPGGNLTVDETYGLAALFNSSLLDGYFRTTNGNTQVSATELRAMPLPALDVILEIGRRSKAIAGNTGAVDTLVLDLACGKVKGRKAVAVG